MTTLFPLLLNTRLAPVAGPVKVTCAPVTGLLLESRTVTANWLANAVFSAAVWLSPPLFVIEAGGGLLITSDRLLTVAVRAVGLVLSFAVMDTVKVPAPVGVPVMAPVAELMTSGAGRPEALQI